MLEVLTPVMFLISGLSPGHCFVPFAQALLHLAVLGAWSPTLESVLRALMTVLLAKASIRSCDGRHSTRHSVNSGFLNLSLVWHQLRLIWDARTHAFLLSFPCRSNHVALKLVL